MAAVCGLQLHAFRPVEDVDTNESIRSLYRVSHLPSVPTHGASIPGLSFEVSTTNIDLLAVSKEFAVKSDLIKRKLIKNKWARYEVEAVESDKSSVAESSDLSGLDNYFSYLTDSSDKYLSLLNDFVSNNQLIMLAIITLASLVTIFTFLYKLVKTLAKFVKFISRGIDKRNKKTKSSLMKTLIKVYLTGIQISKALSSPEITWATPERVSPIKPSTIPINKMGHPRGVSANREFIINRSQTTPNQYTSNAGSSHTITTSNTQIYTAQTNVKFAIIGSIEWRAFCRESLHLLTTDMYPIHINLKIL